jgi:hypothetical protein
MYGLRALTNLNSETALSASERVSFASEGD